MQITPLSAKIWLKIFTEVRAQYVLEPLRIYNMSESIENSLQQNSKIEREEENSQNSAGKDSCLNDGSINEVQAFIDLKYTQVGDLQKYLLQELQYIENCKNRNHSIEHLLTHKVIPTFASLRQTLAIFKEFLRPLFQLAANYVLSATEKCRDILYQKEMRVQECQKQNQQLKTKLQLLTKNITELKESKDNENNSRQLSKKSWKQDDRNRQCMEAKQLQRLKSYQAGGLDYTSKSKQKGYLLEKSTQQVAERRNRSTISPSTRSPYKYPQQLSTSTLQQRKPINIQYRCEKSPKLEGQKRTTAAKAALKSLENSQIGRKQYIKQKIQRIKTKPRVEYNA